MSSFTVHTLETAPEASRAVLAATREHYGFLPNLHAVLAESPVALQALDSLFALIARGTLTPQEQQLAMLAVSASNGCAYCMAGHTYLARSVNLDEAALQAVRGRRPIDAQPRHQALRSFTEAALESRGHVGAGPRAAFFEAGYDRQAALEVLAIIAAKTLANYTNNLAGTPAEGFMDDPALNWVAPVRTPAP